MANRKRGAPGTLSNGNAEDSHGPPSRRIDKDVTHHSDPEGASSTEQHVSDRKGKVTRKRTETLRELVQTAKFGSSAMLALSLIWALWKMCATFTPVMLSEEEFSTESSDAATLSLLSIDPAHIHSHKKDMFKAIIKRNATDTGIDVSDPHLYHGEDLKGDSSTTTVIGMSTGYDLKVYEQFVGSLRKANYNGNIILGELVRAGPTPISVSLH
jgi:hypothetical protein